MHHQGSIWDRNFGGGGGRRGVCRAHRITILKHMTQGWIQYLKGGGAQRCTHGVDGKNLKYCLLIFIIIDTSQPLSCANSWLNSQKVCPPFSTYVSEVSMK